MITAKDKLGRAALVPIVIPLPNAGDWYNEWARSEDKVKALSALILAIDAETLAVRKELHAEREAHKRTKIALDLCRTQKEAFAKEVNNLDKDVAHYAAEYVKLSGPSQYHVDALAQHIFRAWAGSEVKPARPDDWYCVARYVFSQEKTLGQTSIDVLAQEIYSVLGLPRDSYHKVRGAWERAAYAALRYFDKHTTSQARSNVDESDLAIQLHKVWMGEDYTSPSSEPDSWLRIARVAITHANNVGTTELARKMWLALKDEGACEYASPYKEDWERAALAAQNYLTRNGR